MHQLQAHHCFRSWWLGAYLVTFAAKSIIAAAAMLYSLVFQQFRSHWPIKPAQVLASQPLLLLLCPPQSFFLLFFKVLAYHNKLAVRLGVSIAFLTLHAVHTMTPINHPSHAVHAVQGNSKLQNLLKVHSMGEPPFPVTRHSFPDYSSIAAPVALPVEKDRVRLQVRASTSLVFRFRFRS